MSDLKEIIKLTKEAQKKYSTFTQEQVDKIFYEAAKAANEQRIMLAKLAVEDTKMGVVEDKVIKNHFASEYIYNKYRDLQTVGTYEKDKGLGYELMYEPMGIVAAIIPTTNPTSTVIFKCLIALKTRNGIIVSPHPRGYKSTVEAAQIILNAAVKAGAPKNIISWLPPGATMDDTATLMKESDIILATGGGGLVKAAYSSGKPAIGVGAGNCPVIIDNSANIKVAVSSIIQSNTFDNGVVCATENSVIVVNEIYQQVVGEFEKQAAYIIKTESDIKKVRDGMFKEGQYGLLNPAMVGQTPQRLGEIFKIEIPNSAKILIVPTKSTNYDEPLAHEKLSTLVSIYKAKDFEDALKIQRELLLLGPGHTSSLFVDEWKHPEKIEAFKNSAMTARLVVNMPSSLGAIGDVYNFHLSPSLTLGCGTWGGNMFSENIGPKHLLNKKEVALRRENMLWLRLPKKIYFKYGCLPIALTDLKQDNVKKVFIVSDAYIWSMVGPKLTKILEDEGMIIQSFTNVEPNPTLGTTLKATKQLTAFNPEAIIAIGGGSALDAAKLMWLYNEYPNAKFEDLALRFSDIRKRIVRYPDLGKRCQLICVPTTSGTGSEVTPFAVITDENTHIKYPLADYALTPDVAIIDCEFMMTLPPKMTAITAADSLSHAFEAYVSVLATEFTDAYALSAIKTIFEFLPRAYTNGSVDKEAREKIANAATMAGIAFANAFLGLVHSLSHKIGGHFNVTHGAANAIYLPHVIAYNSQTDVREKQMYFSQNDTPKARQKYAAIADHLNLGGKTEEEKIDLLIVAIQKLMQSVGIAMSTKEYGVNDQEFEKIVDKMSEEAFDDQCTGANPRYPLISDLKQLYLNAHFNHPIEKFSKK